MQNFLYEVKTIFNCMWKISLFHRRQFSGQVSRILDICVVPMIGYFEIKEAFV